MKSTKVELSPQVAEYMRSLAPEPRTRLRLAIKDLSDGRGDILELEHPLHGYFRLRAGRYRIVFHYHIQDRHKVIRCDFAERRELVYELFMDLVRDS